MNHAKYTINRRIERIVTALMLIVGITLPLGNVSAATDNETSAAASSIVRKGRLAAPSYTQEWVTQGARGDRLLITVSAISGGIVPEVELISRDSGSVVASVRDNEHDTAILDCELESTGAYTVAIKDQGLDNEGTYKISLEKTAGPEPVADASVGETGPEEGGQDESGLSGKEVGAMVAVGTVLSVLTGPFAPLVVMIAARIAVLFPG